MEADYGGESKLPLSVFDGVIAARAGAIPIGEIARTFGISRTHVWRIIHGKVSYWEREAA